MAGTLKEYTFPFLPVVSRYSNIQMSIDESIGSVAAEATSELIKWMFNVLHYIVATVYGVKGTLQDLTRSALNFEKFLINFCHECNPDRYIVPCKRLIRYGSSFLNIYSFWGIPNKSNWSITIGILLYYTLRCRYIVRTVNGGWV